MAPHRTLLLPLIATVAGCVQTELPTDRGAVFADAAATEDAGTFMDPRSAPQHATADPPDVGTAIEPEPVIEPEPEPAPEPCRRVKVTPRDRPLPVRRNPRTGANVVTRIAAGLVVRVVGTREGDRVNGQTLWYEIDTRMRRGFVSAAKVECTERRASFEAFDGYYLPFNCGRRARVSQCNNSSFSHNGFSAYAFDFALPLGTMMRAMADGVVIGIYDRTRPGDPCYSGGGPGCITQANWVRLLHADGRVTSYTHLNSVRVVVGQSVPRGRPVGRTGSTGYSTGPHAHIARESNCGASACQSIRLRFQDVRGDGVPATGDYVTSDNCF